MKRLYTSFLILALMTLFTGCAEVIPSATDAPQEQQQQEHQQQKDTSTERKAVEDTAVQFLKSTLGMKNWTSNQEVSGLDYADPEIHEDIVSYLPSIYDYLVEQEGQESLPEVGNVKIVKVSNAIPDEYRIKAEVTFITESKMLWNLEKPELIIELYDGKPIISHVVFSTHPKSPDDAEQFHAMAFARDFLKKAYTVRDAKDPSDTQGLDSVWAEDSHEFIQETFDEIYGLVEDHESDREAWPVVQNVILNEIVPLTAEEAQEFQGTSGYVIIAELEFDAEKAYVPYAHPVLVITKQNDKWVVNWFVHSLSQYLQLVESPDGVSL